VEHANRQDYEFAVYHNLVAVTALNEGASNESMD
jgi:predicted nucleic acid-binding protein